MTELWMLDLDQDGLPWQAHLIVEDCGSHRITACGERSYQMRGWWTTENGDLPLSGPTDIHCGRTPEQVVEYRTAKGWVAMDEHLEKLAWPPPVSSGVNRSANADHGIPPTDSGA